MGDAFGGAVAVRGAFGEEMPDDDEETVGDDDNGIVGVFAAREFLEAALPEGMAADGAPGDLDQSPAEVFAAFFGDGFGAFRDAALVDARGEAGVTDEVLRGGETSDVADGGEDGHGGDDAEAGELHEQEGLGGPGFLLGKGGEAVGEALDLGFEVVFGFEVEFDLPALGVGEGVEPGEALFVEAFAFGVAQVMAMRDAVKAVDDLGVHLDEFVALADEAAEVADVLRRDPDFGDEVGGEEAGEEAGIFGVGLDAGLGDLGDADGVGHLDESDERGKEVVDMPGVGGGFDDDVVGGAEVLLGPLRERVEGDAARFEEDLSVVIHSGDDGIMLVDIKSDKTGCGRGRHRLYSKERIGGAWIFGRGGYTLIRARSPDEDPPGGQVTRGDGGEKVSTPIG